MLRKAAYDPFAANEYPSSDGKPIAETDWHRDNLVSLLDCLDRWYAADSNVYVSGALLIYYELGSKRRRVAPDCLVVKGVPKGDRTNFLLWEEGKGPDVVIELTSKKTKTDDLKQKLALYRDKLGVKEYFLFDPKEDDLDPSLQGVRRVKNEFRSIHFVEGRLPSKVLGLHLERERDTLRLWNLESGAWLPTQAEREELLRRENDDLRRQLGSS